MLLEIVTQDAYGMRELQADRIATIVDVGANVGVFSVTARVLFPNARILAYEPVRANLRDLEKNLEGSGVEVRPLAVGGRGGTATMCIDKTDHTSCHLIDHSLAQYDNRTELESVAMVTLDDVVKAIDGPIDLLKLDCEGAEYDLFQSDAMKVVERVRAELHFTSTGTPEIGMQILRDRGFQVVRWTQFADGKGLLWADATRRSTQPRLKAME